MKSGLFIVLLLILPLSVRAQELDAVASTPDTDVEDESTREEELIEPDAADGSNEFDGFGDMDALFGDEMLEYAEEPDEGFSPEDELLSSDGPTLRWGGRISGSVSTELSYNGLWSGELDLLEPDDELLTPSIQSTLYFDARPDPDFRAFGKLQLGTDSATADFADTVNSAALTGDLPEGWTREETAGGETIIRDADGGEVFTVAAEDDEEPQTGTPPGISLEVLELFSDLSYNDHLFFRFGKHTIKWGVGYFWSPADVLNLTAIDVEDPTADREGPVSLKIQYPFDLNNLYLYLITNAQAKPLEVAVAPKFEFVIGLTEIGVAAYYQRALSPRGIVTFSSTINEMDVFGEGVVSFGSDRVFVRESRKRIGDFEEPPEDLETVLDTYTFDLIPVFSVTVGARYIKELDQNDLERAPGSLVFIGQYFYNGEGYADSSLLKPAVFLQQNPEYNGLALPDSAQTEDYKAPPPLSLADLSPWGRHYAAGTAAWNNIFDSDISVSVFNVINLSDLSGIVSPALSFNLIDLFDISLALRMTYGHSTDEYTNPGSLFGLSDASGATASLSLNISMGTGSF